MKLCILKDQVIKKISLLGQIGHKTNSCREKRQKIMLPRPGPGKV
jgi:hypothetical protein